MPALLLGTRECLQKLATPVPRGYSGGAGSWLSESMKNEGIAWYVFFLETPNEPIALDIGTCICMWYFNLAYFIEISHTVPYTRTRTRDTCSDVMQMIQTLHHCYNAGTYAHYKTVSQLS